MEKDIYKNSRICYVIEETTAYLITLLISGAYLARLTSSLGFSDSLTALLGSFVNLGCLFQLLAIAVFRQGSVKRKVSILYIINELLFMMLYLVPFFKISATVKAALFVFFLLGGYFIFNTVSSTKTNWFMSLIPDRKRGSFTALKEGITLVSSIVFNFTMGLLIDHYEAMGNTSASFILCGITIFVLAVVHTLSLVFAKEKEYVKSESSALISGIKDILTDKNISPIILISALWGACYGISVPFFGTFQIKELGFSMTFVAVLSFINAVSRISASIFLGRYADRTSFAKMLKICYFLVAAGFLSISFTRSSNGYVTYTIYEIFFAMAMGGINSAQINLVFDYAGPDKRKNALAVNQTVYGLCGFFSTLIVTPLVNYVQASENMLFGIPIYAQQVLAFISLVLAIILILYISNIIVKLKPNNRR